VLFVSASTGAPSLEAQAPNAPGVKAGSTDTDERAPVVFTGFVLEPDGSPASNAFVTSSAGGRAVVDRNGRFHLVVQVALAVERVELSAVGGGDRSRTARAFVGVTAAPGPIDVGTLALGSTDCIARWAPTFGSEPGADGGVWALTSFDDGSGPALYAAGRFEYVGGLSATNIAKWNGSSWETVGEAPTGHLPPRINALVAFDDGSGPALYAGGSFTTIGGVVANNVAKWNGSSWLGLGSGTDDEINALAAFDDGSGLALYAGGWFTDASGAPARRIAKWDGAAWTPLGNGCNSTVWALHVFDDGGGPALYVGGTYATVSGVTANGIARWDGSHWSALGTGLGRDVQALAEFDDGSGPALYAGGGFFTPGGHVAKWNGASWVALGAGVNGSVRALVAFDDGQGAALYVAGHFSTGGSGSEGSQIEKWDGSDWAQVGAQLDGRVLCLSVLESGSASALYVGGEFTHAGNDRVRRIAKCNGTSVSPLGSGGLNGSLQCLASFDDGSGPGLFAAGTFTSTGTVAASRLAKWDGAHWSAVAGAPSGSGGLVSLVVLDDGSGPALYGGGSFARIGGISASRIARWDGSTWRGFGSGMNQPVYAFALFDDGSGLALYAGGDFTTAGGQPANRVARWNGTSWSSVGAGGGLTIFDLVPFDDGSGPALYAAGRFTIAGSPTDCARWNGSTWSSFGGGLNGVAFDLATFDDGSGPALFAAGRFQIGSSDAQLAKWDGVSWQAIGRGNSGSFGYSLTDFDDGRGVALYASGSFTSLNGSALNRIARWTGSGWEALGRGLSGGASSLASFDDGQGAALFAAGDFTSALDSHDSFLAKWLCTPDATAPVIHGPAFVFETDRGDEPGEFVSFTVTASDDLDPAPIVTCVPPSGSFFPRGTTLVQCSARDASNNQGFYKFEVTVERKLRQR
jgi:hypothetical protein